MWVADPNGERIDEVGRYSWSEKDAHAVVYETAGLYVGIRGYRSAGVTFAELMRVAAGLA